MFDLFEEIDETKTKMNVRRYLRYNLQRLMDICGISASQLQSPIITDMPTSKPNGNRNEDAA